MSSLAYSNGYYGSTSLLSQKTKTLSPLQNSQFTYGMGMGMGMGMSNTNAISTVSAATQTAAGCNNLINSIKLLGPAASIDLGNTPLTHRNYHNTIKGGFTFRRSFDEKIIGFEGSSGIGSGSGSGSGSGATLMHLPSVSQAPQLFPHHHSAMHHQYHNHYLPHATLCHNIATYHHATQYHHHQQHHHHHHHHQHQHQHHRHHTNLSPVTTLTTTKSGINNSLLTAAITSNAMLRYNSEAGNALTSSQSTTKLYRDDFLQQTVGYLPTTRIFSTTSSTIDDDKSQADFLSLSLSPPLNRRRDMPALRGPFISL